MLLTELLNAVEGVERSLQAMQTAAVAAQAKADDYTAQFSPRDPEPVHGSHLSDPVVADVWDKFINMIVWARAVEGRVQRRGEGGDPGRGLRPALAEARFAIKSDVPLVTFGSVTFRTWACWRTTAFTAAPGRP